MSEQVAVVGAGYVGQVTGACLASVGHEVMLVDIKSENVEAIMAGRASIEEPGLSEIIREARRDDTLMATTDLAKAVGEASIVLLALPTPRGQDGSFNLKAIWDVAGELGELIKPDTIVATRSTVEPGTTHAIGRIITERTGAATLAVSNPEFLAEGRAVEDTLKPSRIVIGSDHAEADERMRHLYRDFALDNPGKILSMDPVSAEFTKLYCNARLANDITLTNIGAEICEQIGADYRLVQKAATMDPRIGRFLHPSAGFGGACFPKDVPALAALGRKHGIDVGLLDEIEATNEHMKQRVFEKVSEHFGGSVAGLKIAVWGLTFKAETDDVRESASLTLLEQLAAAGAEVVAYDPKGMENAQASLGDQPNIAYATNKYEPTVGADALVVMTEWRAFRNPDFDHLAETMRQKVIFDWRSLYEPADLTAAHFDYISVGRQPVRAHG